MPKLYEYCGLIIMFYSNEHEPVHVHAKSQGREARAEIILVDGHVAGINFSQQPGRQPLKPSEQRNFEELVNAKAVDIVQKWIDYFVLHRHVPSQSLTRRLK